MTSSLRRLLRRRWVDVTEFRRTVEALREGQAQLLRAVEALQDRESESRERLRNLRASLDYESAFSDPEPLVSVTIPTWKNLEGLSTVAIPSVLAQTYSNFEIVVVGDASPPETQQALKSFADERIRYVNLALRGPYPDDAERRWYVAGVPAINQAAQLARGAWIAPLNDDDAFTPDHIELLLAAARRQASEVAYGRFVMSYPDRPPFENGLYPPVLGGFTWQAAVYHGGLRFFEMELGDAWFDRPGDWSLCRRMLVAGVRFTMVDDVVAHLYPSAAAKSEVSRGE
jgi:glycosyltransferase involved in cell wall biosynthesis